MQCEVFKWYNQDCNLLLCKTGFCLVSINLHHSFPLNLWDEVDCILCFLLLCIFKPCEDCERNKWRVQWKCATAAFGLSLPLTFSLVLKINYISDLCLILSFVSCWNFGFSLPLSLIERLWRPPGLSEQWLLGPRGRHHPNASLRTPRSAQYLHPRVTVRGLDEEGHGDGIAGMNPSAHFIACHLSDLHSSRSTSRDTTKKYQNSVWLIEKKPDCKLF